MNTTFHNEVGLSEAIRELVATTFGLSTADVHESFSAAELAAWDSLHHFTLIVTLEDQFGVTYTSDEIPQMRTVPDIARVTARYLGINGAG